MATEGADEFPATKLRAAIGVDHASGDRTSPGHCGFESGHGEATDTGTDLIATLGADHAHMRPWIVCNAYSRLVVDPERFPDDSESAAAYGRGAVYTRTCTGTLLRQESLTDADALLDTYFRPYATAVSELVTDRIAARGRAVIIDVHSYPSARRRRR